MRFDRRRGALGVMLALFSGPLAAQPNAALVGPRDPVQEIQTLRSLPSFRMPEGDLRLPTPPRRSGLIAAYPVDKNLEIGVGRFAVPEIARPRTHMENERHPAAVRPRDRGIAAIGFSLRFD